MKKLSLIFGIMLLSVTAMLAQTTKTDTITVNGACGMCETRIEKATQAVKGVTKADWSSKTQQLIVTYDETKTEINKIHEAVSKVGHDTELMKADDKTYNALHGCCKYRK
ncbi:heavy-metal-associated domain-containing protein [Bacteroidota bacterium]